VHDYGLIGSEGAYLAMELVHGSTWRAELNRAGNLDGKVAAE
jgi:eukaryotic-like serine/threonine-protein kinase